MKKKFLDLRFKMLELIGILIELSSGTPQLFILSARLVIWCEPLGQTSRGKINCKVEVLVAISEVALLPCGLIHL